MPSASVTTALTDLPRYYTYREVLALFDHNEDAFLDAFCGGTLPLPVRQVCTETLDPQTLHTWLLRRLIRQQAQMLALLGRLSNLGASGAAR